MAVKHSNPHIAGMEEDVLYHLGLSTGTHDLVEMFGDIKFVCMGGTPHRMEKFAHYIMKEIGYKLAPGTCLMDISKPSHRYSMFKVGPVLSVSHGMGAPSLSILLHEIIKLLAHAGAKDPVFFRLGTCGGVGLEGGTLVVTDQAVNGLLEPVHEQIVLGKRVQLPAKLDSQLQRELIELGQLRGVPVVSGKTMCTDDFYEGQGRLDGAFCEYKMENKMNYLRELNKAGVRNIEMESSPFAALTHRAGIRAAVICVTLLNRLNGDQISTTAETMAEWTDLPQVLAAAYIKKQLNIVQPGADSTSMAAREKALARLTSYEDEKKNGS